MAFSGFARGGGLCMGSLVGSFRLHLSSFTPVPVLFWTDSAFFRCFRHPDKARSVFDQ